MRRMTGDTERGAVAVLVAVMMVALIGFAALGIDVAQMSSHKQQLQNGADAGALAVAQKCANGNCSSNNETPTATADALAKSNRADGQATASILTPGLNPSTGVVEVETSGDSQHWLAPVLGIEKSTIRASATAVWGTLSSGTAMLPVAISACQIEKLITLGDPTFKIVDGKYVFQEPPSKKIVTIPLVHPSNKDDECKPMGSPNIVPGGFSFITDGLKSCSVYTTVGKKVFSDPGAAVPSPCTLEYLKNLVTSNKPVAIPVFIEFSDAQGGSNAWYTVYAYAGFQLTGFALSNQVKYNSSCSGGGNNKCLEGYFTNVVDFSGELDPTQPDLGAATVKLTK